MADIFSKSKRSQIMASITGKNTKPETLVAKFLFSQGYRYRKNVKSLPGKPDIVLAKYRIAIFVNGCFWHGHSCKAAKLPATRTEFWDAKIGSNKLRDKRNYAALKKMGYKVILVWQCDIKNKLLFETEMKKVISSIKKVILHSE